MEVDDGWKEEEDGEVGLLQIPTSADHASHLIVTRLVKRL